MWFYPVKSKMFVKSKTFFMVFGFFFFKLKVQTSVSLYISSCQYFPDEHHGNDPLGLILGFTHVVKPTSRASMWLPD